MESTETLALTQLTNQRFRSFSEAVDSVLGALEETIPGTVMLGQLDPAEELCRVIDVRGTSIHLQRGMTLPLAAVTADENTGSEGDGAPGVPIDGGLDREFLRSLSVEAWLAMPLEMSDGSIIGTLCALDTDTETYRRDHLVMLGVAARLLSYEWEGVSSRAELQRLRERVRDVQSSDADTGLPNRERFLDLLDREWRLTARGSVQSVLVACHVSVDEPQGGLGETMDTLALKDAAEVLSATARSTDHVGRTGKMDLAAILVGCHGVEGAQAFAQRFRAGVKRVTHGRAMPVSAFCSMQDLAESPSAGEALEHAERVARDTSAANPTRGSALNTGRTHE
jgi:GGDEF domain-containing protein